MSHTPHELAEAFPDKAARIHELKGSSTHFARLAETYHELNREIHRIETDLAPAADDVLEAKKKARLKLLDEIQILLAA